MQSIAGGSIFEAITSSDVDKQTLAAATKFIQDTLTHLRQQGSYGIIMKYGKFNISPLTPSIILGLPEPEMVYDRIGFSVLPIVILLDRAVPTVALPQSSWLKETIHKTRVQVTDISLGKKGDIQTAGSFGGWFKVSDGDVVGLTCSHCLPDSHAGDQVVSPSSLELTSRFSFAIPYTMQSPNSPIRISPLKTTLVQDFLTKYTQQTDSNGVRLANGNSITLSGPPIGVVRGKAFEFANILQAHNQRLPSNHQFLVQQDQILMSRLDWLAFSATPERVGGNWLPLDDCPITQLGGPLKPGDQVTKTGRTTGHTTGTINGVYVIMWTESCLSNEIAVVRTSTHLPGPFADIGDSGSLVVRQNTNGEAEAVGLVIAKSSSVWVAVTPLWAVIQSMECALGFKVTLADSGDGAIIDG